MNKALKLLQLGSARPLNDFYNASPCSTCAVNAIRVNPLLPNRFAFILKDLNPVAASLRIHINRRITGALLT